MTQATNDQFLLAARPVGLPKDSDWQRATPPLAELLEGEVRVKILYICLLYTSPSPRDRQKSRMPSSA